MLKRFLLLTIATLVMLPVLADKPPDKGNKDGGGFSLDVVFRHDYTVQGENLVSIDRFGSDGFDANPSTFFPYLNGESDGSVSAHIDKFRFGLNVGMNGPRHFYLDLRDCISVPDSEWVCTLHRPFASGLTTGWNVFAFSPDGAQFLKMSASDDDSQPVNLQLEFRDTFGNGWRIMFNPSECPKDQQGGNLADMVTVTKTSDSPATWEFEATADKRACLQFREGPRKNHFIAGLYSLPFRIMAQAIEQP